MSINRSRLRASDICVLAHCTHPRVSTTTTTAATLFNIDTIVVCISPMVSVVYGPSITVTTIFSDVFDKIIMVKCACTKKPPPQSQFNCGGSTSNAHTSRR